MAVDNEKHIFQSAFSEVADNIIGAYITTVGLLSLCANIVVLGGTIKKKRKITDMDIITINISICQLAPTILSYPLILVSAFSHGWSFSEQDCKRDGFFIYFFAMNTIALLLLMTVYRYFRMFKRHLFIKRNASRVRLLVFVGLAACYLYGLLWALPPLMGYGSYTVESHELGCSLEWTSLPLPYILTILVCGYLLPVTTMFGIYSRILVTVRSSRQHVGTSSSKTFRKAYNVTIVCILHCASFLLVWTPYAILSFMIMFSHPVPNSLYVTSSFFAKVDTLINPFVFFVFRKTMSDKRVKKDKVREPMLKKQEDQRQPIQLGSDVSRV